MNYILSFILLFMFTSLVYSFITYTYIPKPEKDTYDSVIDENSSVTFTGPRVGFDGQIRILPSLTPGISF